MSAGGPRCNSRYASVDFGSLVFDIRAAIRSVSEVYTQNNLHRPMNALFRTGLLAAISVAVHAAGICETLARRTPESSKPIVVEVEAILDGDTYHGYKLFEDTARPLCPQSSKARPLRPILAICWEKTEECPSRQESSEQGRAALQRQVEELQKHQALGKQPVLRLRMRGTLIRKPATKILCEDDICWGSGFGNGSIAAAIVPLFVTRIP